MATLDTTNFVIIRQKMTEKAVINYTKPVVNAAAQAVEDWLDNPTNQASLASAINTATGGNVLNATQKKQIFLCVVLQKFMREF